MADIATSGGVDDMAAGKVLANVLRCHYAYEELAEEGSGIKGTNERRKEGAEMATPGSRRTLYA